MSEQKHRCGWVALMGPPNAGKSTLLNAYLGQKVAIVTSKPQTTRNQITGILSEPDSQVIFMDTPGIHKLRGKMNRILLQAAWQAMASADVLVAMLDGDLYIRRPEFLDKDIEPMLKPIAEETRPVAVVINKIDMFADKSKMLPLLEKITQIWPNAEVFPISALTGNGLEALLEFIKKHLPIAPPQFPTDQLSTLPIRFMAAEIIREKLFNTLRQELPYSTTVDIENWEEDKQRKITFINAVIYVARGTHKAMVIGKGGQNLKKVGQFAREEISTLIDQKVHLELFVKVREDWQEDLNFLHSIGLGNPHEM
ncbi:GTPase Era [Desulfovibrio litoralis]|uniref:GTPase Era n=1 Tax=Desulfovibrio litoralis DSM 11393 TaxID=1121455 RepID=A0A1M7SAK2_9BACT|nr:GTPase Era [Desulfovibrio litoralis]SHN55473.1 GTP-binding protein Era [Desulfovibrio litoralis DSM 11393]